MGSKLLHQRSLVNLPQLLVGLTVLVAFFVALDLNRRAVAGRQVGAGEASLEAEVAIESTRQVELQATLTYVESDDYVAAYARDEGGYILPGEKRVVPLVLEAASEPTPTAAATPDPAYSALPWQAWWQLLTDAPQPSH